MYSTQFRPFTWSTNQVARLPDVSISNRRFNSASLQNQSLFKAKLGQKRWFYLCPSALDLVLFMDRFCPRKRICKRDDFLDIEVPENTSLNVSSANTIVSSSHKRSFTQLVANTSLEFNQKRLKPSLAPTASTSSNGTNVLVTTAGSMQAQNSHRSNHKEQKVFPPEILEQLRFFPKLLEYQRPHVTNLAYLLQRRFLALDASGTGTGKSFAAFGIAEAVWSFWKLKDPTIKPKIAIVCPKPILAEFCRLAKEFEQYVEVVFVCNIELLCRGKYIPWSRYSVRNQLVDIDHEGKEQTIKVVQTDKDSRKSVVCPYVKRIDPSPVASHDLSHGDEEGDDDDQDAFIEEEFKETRYEWHLPPYTTVIFDEAHKVRNPGTCFNRLVQSLVEKYRSQPIEKCTRRAVLASATILENAKCGLASLLYLLRYVKRIHMNEVKKLLHMEPLRSKLMQRETSNLLPYTESEIDMRVLHYLLYDSNAYQAASRMTIEQAHAMFAKNHPGAKIVKSEIRSEAYVMSAEAEIQINKAQKDLLNALSDLKDGNRSGMGSALLRILRARQVIEHYKLPSILKMAMELYEQKWSIVIFVNFKQSAKWLKETLQEKLGLNLISLVIGGQTTKERDFNIQLFQQDRSRILVTTIASGGASISLQDKTGNFPRFSLISPPISATQLKQCLGRIDRSGAVTDSKQRLFFCKNTVEEQVAKNLNVKIRGMDMLNDGFIGNDTMTLFEFARVGTSNVQDSRKRNVGQEADHGNSTHHTLHNADFDIDQLLANLKRELNNQGAGQGISKKRKKLDSKLSLKDIQNEDGAIDWSKVDDVVDTA